jgi:DNA-binding MurR/RpiR family transcriptional regulator
MLVNNTRANSDSEGQRPSTSVLIRVRGAIPNLRPAERRVAEVVLQDPAHVSESSITAIARQCQTSETTVLRFCRAIGLAGYPELRIALARAALWEEEDRRSSGPITGEIGPADTLQELVAKITHADSRAVEDTAAALNLDVLQSAVDAVVKASRIDIYGIGASALCGNDLQQKLHRLGLVCFVWSEPHLALMSAAMLSSGDVAIGISHSGTTIDTVDAMRQAGSGGARTIAVTNFSGSQLAAVSDLVLLTAARETTFRTGSMSSRIAQLALVDCLFAAVAQTSYDESIEKLRTTSAVVESRHGR